MRSSRRRCPYCGSQHLVWDDYSGFLVCAECGAVIEQLIDEESASLHHEGTQLVTRKQRLPNISRSETLPLPLRENSLSSGQAGDKLDVREARNEQSDSYKELIDMLASRAVAVISQHYNRNSRALIALSYYAAAKALGTSHSAALELSASMAGLSRSYVRKLLAESKSLLRRVSLGLLDARTDAPPKRASSSHRRSGLGR